MKRWDQRPFEIRNLFNPAFCGLVLFRALHGYEEEDARGMPFSLSLLVLPLCLHKDSREVIASQAELQATPPAPGDVAVQLRRGPSGSGWPPDLHVQAIRPAAPRGDG